MSDHGLPGIGIGRTIPAGIAKALAVGTLPGSLAHYLLSGLPDRTDHTLSVLVWGGATVALLAGFMRKETSVEVGEYGLHLVFGELTGKIYGPGDHPLYPEPAESLMKVNSREKRLDPPAFEDIAQDNVPVFADGYFMAQVIDPILFVTSVDEEEAHDAMMNEFDSEIRLFINQWSRAEDIKSSKELLVRFLKLNGNLATDEAARRLKDDLLKLTPLHGKSLLTAEAVDNIMEDAGKFCATAARWGYRITQIHFQKLDIPQYIKDAATRAAAARSEMDEAVIRQERRSEMIRKFKEDLPGLSDRDAMLGIDLLLKLPVTRSVTEIEIRDLEAVSANLGATGAVALEALQRLARYFGRGARQGD